MTNTAVKIAFCLAVGLLFIKCEPQTLEGENSGITNINLDEVEWVSPAEIFANVEVVQLEEHPEALLKSPTKVQVYGDEIFVLDYALKTVFIFTDAGTFVEKVVVAGDDFFPMHLIADVNINPFNGQIDCLYPTGEVWTYDRQLQEFEVAFKGLPELLPLMKFTHVSPDTLLLFTDHETNEHQLYYVKKGEEGVARERIKNEYLEEVDWWNSNPLSVVDGKVSFLDIMNCRVYDLAGSADGYKQFTFDGDEIFLHDDINDEIRQYGDLFDYLAEKRLVYPVFQHYEDDRVEYLLALRDGAKKIFLTRQKPGDSWRGFHLTDSRQTSFFRGKHRGQYVGMLGYPEYLTDIFPAATLSPKSAARYANGDFKPDGNPLVVLYDLATE